MAIDIIIFIKIYWSEGRDHRKCCTGTVH